VADSERAPPDRLSPDDLAFMRHLDAEQGAAAEFHAKATAAMEAGARHLKAKYQLAGQDRVECETGRIVRAPAPADLRDPGPSD